MASWNPKANDIFLRALEIESPEDLGAFLDTACQNDRSLRAAVERLLKSHREAGDFLENPPTGVDRTIEVAPVLDAGLSPAFDGRTAVVVGGSGHSVLKSLSKSLPGEPHVTLHDSQDDRGAVVQPTSPELPAKQDESPNGEANRVWLNDGNGVFNSSNQLIGNHTSPSISLGDLDGDGDLDGFVANSQYQANRVWLNNGSAQFADAGQTLGTDSTYGSALGDMDGDGDLDVAVANRFRPSQILTNVNLTPSVTLSVDSPTIPEAAGTAMVTATLSAAHSQPVTVNLAVSGSATENVDFAVSGTQIVIPSGTTSGSVTVTAVQDSADEPDETTTFRVSSVTNGQGAGSITITIADDDEPAPVPDVTLAVDNASIPEDGGVATFTATLSQATSVPVVVDLTVGASSTATETADFTLSGARISIAAGETTGSVMVTAVQDEVDEEDETVVLEITAVSGGNELGQQAAAATILDDDPPQTFQVTNLTPTSTGFVARFSAAVDGSLLNLGNTATGGHGPADVVLTGTATGAVSGSLVVDASGQSLTFIASGDRLPADTYNVKLRSAENGLRDMAGNFLDGDADGVAGGDLTETFTVATDTIELAVPDIVRGPAQQLNLPADTTEGLPISISDGTGVREVTFAVDYNTALLEVTGVSPGVNMPAGATGVLDTSSSGRALVTFSSPVDLPSGPNTLVQLRANVHGADAAEIYGEQHVLDINSMRITNAAGTELTAIDNDGLHVAAFFGDVSGNGGINASDASQVARVAASLDSGFAEFLLTDPMIVGDISGNGVINATDASMVPRYAVQLPVDGIPPIPGGVAIAVGAPANAGQGPARLLTTLRRPPMTIHDRPEADRASTVLGFEVPLAVPDAAVDMVMAGLENPQTADAVELPPALEDAVEQLLSASGILPTE